MSECPITAYPVRIIPFDLGRCLLADDLSLIERQFRPKFGRLEITPRQSSILKGVSLYFQIRESIYVYLYTNGICVIVVEENKIDFRDNFEWFSIPYGENRKKAHSAFFKWEHDVSLIIQDTIGEMRRIVSNHTPKIPLKNIDMNYMSLRQTLFFLASLKFLSIKICMIG